jgi:hypothetical protein
MKAAISILIIIGFILGVYKLWEYWDNLDRQKVQSIHKAEQEAIRGESLPGLPQGLEADLTKAKADGPKATKAFIDRIKKSPLVADPRLAWIELDYVVAVSLQDAVEAKRAFREVKQRVTADSPVYKRVKELEKTYE